MLTRRSEHCRRPVPVRSTDSPEPPMIGARRHNALAPIRDALTHAVYRAIREQIGQTSVYVSRALVIQVLGDIATDKAARIAQQPEFF